MVRTFIAVEIPSDIQQSIVAASNGLREFLPGSLVRWVPPQNIHLTLKFLGDIPPGAVDRLIPAMEQELSHFNAMDVHLTGFGAFPSPARARVLWIGLQAPPSLAALYKTTSDVTAHLSLEDRDSRYSPHLTIGRVNRNVTGQGLRLLAVNLGRFAHTSLGNFVIDTVTLFKSDLRPSGPIYTPLWSYSLP